MGKTLFDKIWDAHSVGTDAGYTILYVDRHLLHDLQVGALVRLQQEGRAVRRRAQNYSVIDHSIPTRAQLGPYADPDTARMVETMRIQAGVHGFTLFDVGDERNGIVHVAGPEQGITLPGITLVCGDSHTATHGALGCLAFGIGTTEVEHVLATQTILQQRPKTMRVTFDGAIGAGIYSKDMILALIGQIGIAGGTGHAIEYAGQAVRNLSMEARMTLCNMTIEGGARTGMVAPDDKTFDYVKGRPFAPHSADWEAAVAYWKTLPTDPDAQFESEITVDATRISPQVTWGTNPGMVAGIEGSVPNPKDAANETQGKAWARAQEYMALRPGTPLTDVAVQRVFIGSCTNSRIEDLRVAAYIAKGRRVADGVHAMVVPGSGLVHKQAKAEGLDRIFTEAGFDWREPGCSMCIAMNGDMLQPGERSASTSNRNFEGRQGRGGRTHLMSPAMAAAAAVHGRLMDVRELNIT